MARRRKGSLTRKIVVLSVLAFAAFGMYTLYKQNQSRVDSSVQKVGEKAKRVGEVLKD